jgi:hypothetical protein
MPKRTSLKPSRTGLPGPSQWRVNLPGRYTATGKRERYFFKSKQEAETYAQSLRVRIDNFGRSGSVLSPGQQEAAAMAFQRLARHNVSLATVVSDWIARHDLRARSVTLKQLGEAFIKKKQNRSKAYRAALHYTLRRFAALHDKKVCDIEPNEIDRETNSLPPAARNSHLRILKAFFFFGLKRGWLEKNPIMKLDFDEIKNGEVQTLSPHQASALMHAADYQQIKK